MIYGYSTNPKNIQPLKNVKWMNKKAFTLIKDFNFNPYPEKYSFMVDVNRHYAEKLQRNTTGLEMPMIPYFDKNFIMIRSYDVKYDLTKSLKLDFHADNNSRILEAPGAIDSKGEKDSIRANLLKGGDNTMYTQHAKADYVIPINKIPLTDWITANAGYSTDYKWMRAPYSANSLGGSIQNGNQKSLNMQANMLTLYNKVPFLKKVNQGIKKKEDEKAKPKAKLKAPTTNTAVPTPPAVKDTTKKKNPFLLPQYFARTLMMVKNVSANYTNSEGMALAGYNDNTKYLGMHQGSNGLAPGPGFVFGQQRGFGSNNERFTDYAASQNWLVKAGTLNVPFTQSKTENITARANLEPIPSFKIELTANRNVAKNYSEFFKWAFDSLQNDSAYRHLNPTEAGNFSMSFISWKTAFEKVKTNYESAAFDKFLDNRSVISQKFADNNKNSPGVFTGADGKNYNAGYGPTSQGTLMYAFLSAYSGRDPAKYPLEIFPKMPAPNWRITYDGLSKWKPLKKYFKTVTLSHAYRSSYSFAYTNNLKSQLDGTDQTPVVTENGLPGGDYIFYEQLSAVTIAEQFSPLIKADMTLQNNLQFNVAIKKERNLALSFANNQLTEVNSKEFVFGTGYRWKDLLLKNPFSRGKDKKSIKSDLNLKLDFSIRQNLTMIRKVVEAVTQPTAGQTIYSLKTSADYLLTQRITVRLFYDWLLTNPRISTSFRSSNTNGGVSIRFSLI
jgi:cell surface protein SprA